MTDLIIKNLSVTYRSSGDIYHAVRDISLTLHPGDILGMVGESGSGKTTLGKAILRLIPPPHEVQGQIYLGDKEILSMSNNQFRKLRWHDIATVPQSSMNSLNPVIKVGNQIVECFITHTNISTSQAKKNAIKLMELVGLPAVIFNRYPHQLSGGMRQRVIIAMSMALRPHLLVLDEPTTALDVIVQYNILTYLHKISLDYTGIQIFITHDISMVFRFCNRVAVMYAGKILEEGDTDTIINKPSHPYTMGLLAAIPVLKGIRKRLVSIPGFPPSLNDPPLGCSFADRCPFKVNECTIDLPPMFESSLGHSSACIRYQEADWMRSNAIRIDTWGKVINYEENVK